MTEDLLKAIPIGLGLSLTIGPVFFMLLHISISKGFRAALSFDIGVILGDIIFILVAYFGSYKLLDKIKDEPYIFILGGSIMSIYGLIVMFKKQKNKGDNQKLKRFKSNHWGVLGLVTQGFILNFINVGVLFFWMLIMVSFGGNLQTNPLRVFRFFGNVVLVYLLVDIVKILIAKKLHLKLTPEIILKIKHSMGLIIIICGIALALKGIIPKKYFSLYM